LGQRSAGPRMKWRCLVSWSDLEQEGWGHTGQGSAGRAVCFGLYLCRARRARAVASQEGAALAASCASGQGRSLGGTGTQDWENQRVWGSLRERDMEKMCFTPACATFSRIK